jgi:hypothetical protein
LSRIRQTVVASDEADDAPPLPNITQEVGRTNVPRRSETSSSQIVHQEAILTAMEITKCHLDPAKISPTKFPKRLVVVYVMLDRNGDMLEYHHLMKQDEYKEIWGRLQQQKSATLLKEYQRVGTKHHAFHPQA